MRMPWEKAADEAAGIAGREGDGQTGTELMLKGFGLGEVITAAKQMASAGSVAKIMAFADALPEVMERLERIERDQNLILDRLTFILAGPRTATVEPDPDHGADSQPSDDAGTLERLVGGRRRGTRQSPRADVDG